MKDPFLTHLVLIWLVVAFVAVLLMIIRTFLPSARAEMERNARIPFMIKDDDHVDP